MFEQFSIQRTLSPQNSCKDLFDFGKEANQSYSKKKIGDYAYYLKDIIGSGYSSNVYKCFRQSQPHIIYAIKVIKLNKLAKVNMHFLQNQIKILQSLNHPNIIKFHNVYYTQNNCYLVTDNCEGGSLQDHIDKQKVIKFQDVFQQLTEGCKFLAQHLIVHRDIKPANVFLKEGVWKIGDFGFARFLQSKETVVKQMFKVGSPLYMPPETLKNSLYSLKTDSFALGILFFYIITRRYPWAGKDNKELLQYYEKTPFPTQILRNFPINIQDTIIKLCKLNIEERIYISQINKQIKNHEEQKLRNCDQGDSDMEQNIDQQYSIINLLRQEIDLNVVEKIKICKMIHYFILNIQQLQQMQQIKTQLKKMLKLLVFSFGWLQSDSFSKYVIQFKCSTYPHFEKTKQIKQLRQKLNNLIKCLQQKQSQNRIIYIIKLKLIQFSYILKLILCKKSAKLKQYISKTILHPDFSKVFMFEAQIEQIQKLVCKIRLKQDDQIKFMYIK